MADELHMGKSGLLIAGGDYSAAVNQYTFMKASTVANQTALRATAATEELIGILQNKPSTGQPCEIVHLGISKLLIGAGGVTRGALITSDALGKGVLVVGSQTVGAIALESANAGELCTVYILPGAFNNTVEILQALGVAGGYKIARGQGTNVAASDTVVTGLATVVSAVANMEDAPVIGCDRIFASIGDQAGAPVAGSILIKSYKPTAAGDATPIAATTFAKKYNWVAVGT